MNLKSFSLRFWIACLTFAAGSVNSVCLFDFLFPVSHQSGNITQIAAAVASGDTASAFRYFGIVFFFFAGAFVSGVLFHRRSFKLKKRYGLLLLSSSFLFLFFFLFPAFVNLSVYAVGFIMGLQNAMFIFFDGILIRTTHLTGYITDTAFFLGSIIRGDFKRTKEVLFYSINTAAFFLGALISFFIVKKYAFFYLFCLYFFSGIYYFIFRLIKIHKA